MKRVGAILLLLGIVFIGAAYAGYPLSVVSTPTQNYNVNAGVVDTYAFYNLYPYGGNFSTGSLSTTETNPTLIEPLYTIYADNNPANYSGVLIPFLPIIIQYVGNVGNNQFQDINTANGTIDVTVTITNESSGQVTQHTVPISVAVSVSIGRVIVYWGNTMADNVWKTTYTGTVTGSGTFTFYDPYSIFSKSTVYAISFSSGSGTISGGNDSYAITLQPSKTFYVQFSSVPLTSSSSYINNFEYGNFWVGTSLNSMTKIVSWEQNLNLNVPSFPSKIYVVFTFNGTPKDLLDVYYDYNMYSQNNSTSSSVVHQVVFFPSQITSTTINGKFYPYAFVSTINISSPSDILLVGVYVLTNSYNGIPLMEIGGFSDNAPVQPAFSTQQYISFGIGAVLILIGAVWIFKR